MAAALGSITTAEGTMTAAIASIADSWFTAAAQIVADLQRAGSDTTTEEAACAVETGTAADSTPDLWQDEDRLVSLFHMLGDNSPCLC